MKRAICIVLLLFLAVEVMGADIIVTKKNHRYEGQVLKTTTGGLVVRTVEGSVVVIPVKDISKIYRGNKIIDFEERMSYYLEVRRPFLPFIVLSIATGYYAVEKYNSYRDYKRLTDANTPEEDMQNLDASKNDMAWSVVSGLLSLGSLYVALRPMEVKIPIARIKMSATPTPKGVTLSFHF